MLQLLGIGNFNPIKDSKDKDDNKNIAALSVAYTRLLKTVKSQGYELNSHTVPNLQPNKLAQKIYSWYYPASQLIPINKSVYWWHEELYEWLEIDNSYDNFYPNNDSLENIKGNIILQFPNNKIITRLDIEELEKLEKCIINNYIVYYQELSYGKYTCYGSYDLDQSYDILNILRWIGIIILACILAYCLYCIRNL